MSRRKRKRRSQNSPRPRVGRAEQSSDFSALLETPGDPSRAEKVPDIVSALQPPEGEARDAEIEGSDADAAFFREVLDHLRVSPDKVSNEDSAKKLDAAPAKRGRPVLFDDIAKAKVLGLITAGVSQRTAAAYTGINPSTISKAIRRDPQFAREVDQAQAAARVHPLTNIIKASERSFNAARYLYEKVQPPQSPTESPPTDGEPLHSGPVDGPTPAPPPASSSAATATDSQYIHPNA